MLSDQRKRKGYRPRTAKTFRSLGQAAQGVLLEMPKQNTIIKDRLVETAGLLGDDDQSVTFQHSILCQTSLPYRDPGTDVRRWQRKQGNAVLEIGLRQGSRQRAELGTTPSLTDGINEGALHRVRIGGGDGAA